jgi:cytochrome d ubiquinol oxidase subunit II
LTLQVMYLPVMLMLFALVFRGISFEFREHSKASKTFWNWTFALCARFYPGGIRARE